MSAATTYMTLLRQRGGVSAAVNDVLPGHDYEGLSPTIGTQINGVAGGWTGADSIAHQWYRNGVAISGATALDYTPVDADFGLTLTRVETAEPGGVTAESAATAAVNVLMLDRFTTAAAAPLAASRSAEPGPGIHVKASDTGDKASVADGVLVMAGFTGAGNPGYYWTNDAAAGFARAAGVAMLFKAKSSSTQYPLIGWSSSTTISGANMLYAHGIIAPEFWSWGAGSHYALAKGISNTVYLDFANVLQPIGSLLICNNRLAMVFGESTTTPLYPAAMALNTNPTLRVDDLTVAKLPGDWAVNYGMATDLAASAANGETINTEADCIITFNITFATGVTQNIMFRRVDDDNCYLLRFDQAGSTIKLFSKVAGVETELTSTANTQTNGATRRVTIRAIGTRIDAWAAASVISPVNNAYTFRTATTAKVSHAGANFASYPIDMVLPAAVVTPTRLFLPFGDSKTVGTGDGTTPPTGDSTGWPYRLRNLLTADGGKWSEQTRIAAGGWSAFVGASSYDGTIDADIAQYILKPDYIMLNLGINDITGVAPGTLPAQADFETAYTYILTALHTRWPDATIFCTRVWRRDYGASCATLNGYIDTVIAACAPWAVAAYDESVLLENGDNGVTYTSDGVHPNAAGYALIANWYADAIAALEA